MYQQLTIIGRLGADPELRYYDACGDKSDEIKNGFVYMGSGNIHSIKGAPYRSERVFHFWRYNDRTLLDARVTE